MASPYWHAEMARTDFEPDESGLWLWKIGPWLVWAKPRLDGTIHVVAADGAGHGVEIAGSAWIGDLHHRGSVWSVLTEMAVWVSEGADRSTVRRFLEEVCPV